jgi:hypothetical protein
MPALRQSGIAGLWGKNIPDSLRASARTQILIVAVLVVILAAVFVIKKMPQRNPEIVARPPAPTAATTAPGTVSASPGKTLPADTLVPESAFMLVALPDLKSAIEQYKHLALSEIANDPTMRDALARTYDNLDEFKTQIETQYGLLLADFQQALHGQCALAVLPPEEPGKRSPVFMIIADAPTQGPVLRSVVDNVLKKWILSSLAPGPKPPQRPPRAGAEEIPQAATTTSSFKGADITVATLSGIPFYSTSLGGTYLLASARKAVEDAITLQAGGPGTLAASDRYKRLRKKLGDQKDILTLYINIEAIFAAYKDNMTQPLLGFLDRAGMSKSKALVYSAWAEDVGIKERLYVEAPGPRSGLIRVMGQPASKREFLKYVPAAALWCADLGMDSASLWNGLCTLTSGVLPGPSSAGSGQPGSLSKFEQDNKLDVLADLCPALGNEMLVFEDAPEFANGRALPNPVFILKTTNTAKATESLEKILKVIGASWPTPPPAEPPAEQPAKKPSTPSAPATKAGKAAAPPTPEVMFFSDVPHRTHVIRVLTPPHKSSVPNLSFVVGKDFILIAKNPDAAGEALDVVDGLRPALIGDSEFTGLLRHVSSGESALFYYNTKQNLDVMQRLVREQEFPKDQAIAIDYARMPLTEPIAKRILGAAAVVLNDPGGVTMEAYSLAGLPATLALTAFEYTTGLPPSYDPTNIARRALLATNLARVGAALRKYAADHNGAFPPALRQASELVAAGYVTDLRMFYLPSSNMDFASFPDNIDFQFTSLPLTLTSNPNTIVAWERRKGPASGRTVLLLNGAVEWMPDEVFEERMK